MRLILGSASPRRKELLAQLGLVPHEIRAPDIDETPLKNELPLNYCRRIANAKAFAMALDHDEVALCGDTTVALGRRILGKPTDADHARSYLNALSGRRHRVITAIVVKTSQQVMERHVVSTVKFKPLCASEIEGYIATGDWCGKAGAYAIQGPASMFIPWIKGSYSAIVGLPLYETATLLNAAGLSTFDRE